MTAPVQVQNKKSAIAITAPVEVSKSADGGVSMRFFLPKDYSLTSSHPEYLVIPASQ